MLAQSPTSRANVRLASCKTRFKCLRSAFNINTTSLQHVPCAACPGGLSGDLTDSSEIKQHDADMQQPQIQQQQQQPGPQRLPEEGNSQQQEQGQVLPPAYDPQAAAGFAPPPGEKPLWWVEKFEARRRQLAEEQAAAAAAVAPLQKAPAASSGGSSSSGTSGELQVNAQTAAKAAVQIVQLLLVTAVLILWPASLYPRGLATLQIWMLYVVYMLFFAGGSLYRLLRYGELAPRAKDAQGRTWYSTAAWLLFVAAIPIIHWPPIRSFLLQQQQHQQYHQVASTAAAMSHVTFYDIIGVVNLASAVILNWWAARALGKAYDRVVRPEELVTCGPYAFIRHPIYTSYMLLFSGYAMLLHSASTAVFAVAICVVYYSVRTRLEQAVLQEAFGEMYDQYVKRTKMFLPFVW